MKTAQPWIGKPWTDTLFILLPPFASLAVIMLFPAWFGDGKEVPEAGWVILVLLIDVAHVYSTLYRTYFDPESLRNQRTLLWIIPFVGWLAGVLLYSLDSLIFWRVLAYVAVFHFVRQQYGFMRVYSRREPKTGLSHLIDKLTIYYAALYPLLYWHLKGQRQFNWFVEGDFYYVQWSWLLPIATALYFIIVGVYLVKEALNFIKYRTINIPRFAIITGTLLSWYFGIVYYNGDMAYTLLNVVSHGIPYMALVWLHGQKQHAKTGSGSRLLKVVFGPAGIAIFLGIIFGLAFIEEGLWDMTVWREHQTVFGNLPRIEITDKALCFLVPLLALPQITHYILDGFIWKIKNEEFTWKDSQKESHYEASSSTMKGQNVTIERL